MEDRNDNGIPDSHEFIYLVVRCLILLWSLGMLSASYFMETKIDKTFMASLMSATTGSFGVDIMRKNGERERQGRTSAPTRRTTSSRSTK